MDEEKLEELKKELEELRPLKDESAKAKADFDAKEKAWADEKAKLEQEVNPNWKRAREQMEKLQALAKEKGIKFDEEGNPIPKDHIDADKLTAEAEDRARKATREEFLNNRLDELLEGYSAEQAKVVRHLYGKVTAGEEVSMQNIRGFVAQAEAASGFEKPSKLSRHLSSGGSGPRNPDERTGLSDEAAEATASLMGIKVTPKKK